MPVYTSSGIVPTDGSLSDFGRGPWVSVAEYFNVVPRSYRARGAQFLVEIPGGYQEYRLVGGVDLVHAQKISEFSLSNVSFWISPAVNEKINVLPLSPLNGYRVLHGGIIKEYNSGTQQWHDLYGGTGIMLQEGMAVIVTKVIINDVTFTNQIYTYKQTSPTVYEWVRITETAQPNWDLYITEFVQGKRRVRDLTLTTIDLRSILNHGSYFVNSNNNNMPPEILALTPPVKVFLNVYYKDDNNLVYHVMSSGNAYIQVKMGGVFGQWKEWKGDAGSGVDVDASFIPGSTNAVQSRVIQSALADLSGNIANIPAQQPSDWNAESGVTRILNKPTIPNQVNVDSSFIPDSINPVQSRIIQAALAVLSQDISNTLQLSDITFENIIEILGYTPAQIEHLHDEYEPKNVNIQAHINNNDIHYIPIRETTPTPAREGLEFVNARTLKKYISYNNNGNLIWVQVASFIEETIPVNPEWYDLFDFLWLSGQGSITDTHLIPVIGNNITITNKDFTDIDHIPGNSLATFGFTPAMTVTALVGDDMPHMPVNYDNNVPHNVRMIGILKNTVILTQDVVSLLSSIFNLSIFWSGVFNNNGYVKANRNYEDPIIGVIVNYVNDGVVTGINPSTIIYDNNFKYFIVPHVVTQFNFVDAGRAYSFRLIDGIWIPRFDYLDAFMVHRWTFDNNNANDSVGTAHGVTLTNIGYVNDDNLRHGRAATFNNSKIRTSNAPAPNYTVAGYSFVARFKPIANGASNSSFILGKEHWNSGTNVDFGFMQTSGNTIIARWLTSAGAVRDISSINPASLNNFHTAIATWDGIETMIFYLNKVRQGALSINTFYLRNTPFLFGSTHDGNTIGEATRKFTGDISACYIIAKTLSQKEVDYINDFGHYQIT